MKALVTYAHQGKERTAADNPQFKGVGIVRWCALCGTHKPQLGGTLRQVLGGRHWVCSKHPKVTK